MGEPARSTGVHQRDGARPRRGETAARILDVAEQLVQSRGFNGFSYADVAAALGITKASLHYHYAGKAELGEALIARYAQRFLGALAVIDAGDGDAPSALAAYARLYAEVLREQRMCLCGMLAAEYRTLPERMQAAVVTFFADNETWLARVLERGRSAGDVRFDGSAHDAARLIMSALEGSMLIARTRGGIGDFEAAAARLLAGFAAGSVRAPDRADAA